MPKPEWNWFLCQHLLKTESPQFFSKKVVFKLPRAPATSKVPTPATSLFPIKTYLLEGVGGPEWRGLQVAGRRGVADRPRQWLGGRPLGLGAPHKGDVVMSQRLGALWTPLAPIGGYRLISYWWDGTTMNWCMLPLPCLRNAKKKVAVPPPSGF
jgi:hypothetical protein